MTRTEEDLVVSLENRVRAKDDIIEAQYAVIEQLTLANETLTKAVELLSLPRVTDADYAFVVSGLRELAPQKIERMH
jgi:hypothetical protein